jgi:hypothetical protein
MVTQSDSIVSEIKEADQGAASERAACAKKAIAGELHLDGLDDADDPCNEAEDRSEIEHAFRRRAALRLGVFPPVRSVLCS